MRTLLLAGLLAISTWVASAQVNCTMVPAVTPLNQFAFTGGTVTFTANITGGVAPYFVYWADQQGRLLGTQNSITLTQVDAADAGLIYLMAVDQQGCGALTAGKLFVFNRNAQLFPRELDWMAE